jgi:hypothetical protein
MNGLSTILSEASEFVPVLADILIAMLLSWIDLTLHKTSQSAATHKADAVLLDLGVGLLTVAVLVLWLDIFREIYF